MALYGVTTLRAIQRGVDEQRPFRAGNVSGTDRETGVDPGRLPEPERALYLEAAREGRLWYTFLSYQTPIAWRTRDGWVVPDVKYSVTTSGHQRAIRRAIGHLEPRGGTAARVGHHRLEAMVAIGPLPVPSAMDRLDPWPADHHP